MPDLADLFPGFESHWITAPAGRIFARSGGSGEPLLLLHGFPETHVMWHRLAPSLARTHKVVCMDLRGYGWSGAPHADPLHETYSKRAMGEDVLAVLDHFGWVRAAMVGHDRGARVAYRLALDHPGRVTRLAVIDIVPTAAMWGIIAQSHGVIAPHWTWMSDPAPAPEDRIKVKPAALVDDLMASWTASKDLSAFDSRAVAHYRAFVQDPSRITAMCEDYRAGATLDREADDADRAAGRTITCPVLALWGDVGVPSASPDPLGLWKPYAPGITGRSIVGGHFLPEENPQDTGAALAAFLAA